MTTTRTDVVAAAREWLGTPFHHQARLRGVGVDCVGLVIGVIFLIVGLLLIFFVIVAPNGIVGLVQDWMRARRTR